MQINWLGSIWWEHYLLMSLNGLAEVPYYELKIHIFAALSWYILLTWWSVTVSQSCQDVQNSKTLLKKIVIGGQPMNRWKCLIIGGIPIKAKGNPVFG